MAKKLKKGYIIGRKKSNETKKKSPKKYSEAGKGSKSRVSDIRKYAENWEKIFGNKTDDEGKSDTN